MNKLSKLLLTGIFFIVLSSFVSADNYHWECLGNGDSIIRYTCHADCCVLCVKDGYSRVFYRCYDTQMCSCGVSGNVDETNPHIEILTPEDNFYSSSRAVDFHITVDEPVSLYYKDSADERRGYRRICSGDWCMNYQRPLSFSDGCHTVTFKAVDKNYNEGYDQVYFCVDSLKPSISRTYPRQNEYISSIFTVEYTEANLESVILHYKGENTNWFNINLEGCPSGRRQSCSVNVNNLPEGSLTYYFTIADSATEVNSKETIVYVDSTAPILLVNGALGTQEEPTFSDRRVPFDIEIAEPITVAPIELTYTDLEDRRPRARRLCRDCTSYNRDITFQDGFHRVLINASDAAGNSDTALFEFFVDSKSPRISRTYPFRGKYGNGNFTVQYQEDALVRVTLHYTQDGTEGSASKTDCPSGRREECSIYIPNLQNAPLTYYFALTDRAGTTVVSRETDVIIDTIIPEFDMNSPVNGESYYRRVPFNIILDEEVTLEYIDHESYRARYSRLCSRCDNYIRDRPFRTGPHDLTIRATDVAGNIYQEDVQFDVN